MAHRLGIPFPRNLYLAAAMTWVSAALAAGIDSLVCGLHNLGGSWQFVRGDRRVRIVGTAAVLYLAEPTKQNQRLAGKRVTVIDYPVGRIKIRHEDREFDKLTHVHQAATVLLSVVAVGYIVFSQPGERYSTPVGGMASLPLQDGSHVTLNTASRVRVELTAGERRIDLDQGEAFFEVAKDKNRPFVVRAGDKRVIAVGTKFSVLREDSDVRVVVTEGTVRVETIGAPLHLAKSSSGAYATAQASGLGSVGSGFCPLARPGMQGRRLSTSGNFAKGALRLIRCESVA
jgi:hypothetical protein